MKTDQHADTFEDQEANVEICRKVDLVEELDEGRGCMGDIETLGSNKRTDADGRDHVCWRVLEMKTQESQAGVAKATHESQKSKCGSGSEGSRVDLCHGTGGTLEKAAKELLGIPTRTETHVMVDGRVLEAVRRTWEEREKSLEFR